MAKKPPDLADILKEVKWSKWLEITIPTLSPILVAMAWVGLGKIDKKNSRRIKRQRKKIKRCGTINGKKELITQSGVIQMYTKKQ